MVHVFDYLGLCMCTYSRAWLYKYVIVYGISVYVMGFSIMYELMYAHARVNGILASLVYLHTSVFTLHSHCAYSKAVARVQWQVVDFTARGLLNRVRRALTVGLSNLSGSATGR